MTTKKLGCRFIRFFASQLHQRNNSVLIAVEHCRVLIVDTIQLLMSFDVVPKARGLQFAPFSEQILVICLCAQQIIVIFAFTMARSFVDIDSREFLFHSHSIPFVMQYVEFTHLQYRVKFNPLVEVVLI